MSRARLQHLSRAFALATMLLSAPAGAVKLSVSDNTFLDLRLLLQPWYEFKYDPAAVAPQREFTNDFFLRRTRIVLGGQVTKWVSFFVDTDIPNWGRNGNWSVVSATRDATTGSVTGVRENTGFIIQDAWVSFDLHESFHVVAGMVLLPFIRTASQGATSLHTLDYHLDLMRYPPTGDKVWRNTGVLVRGLLLKKKIDYRVALTNGVADNVETVAAKKDASGTVISPAVLSKTQDAPRVTGRVAYNFFDAEDSFFLGGTYLGAKKILSVGAAFDFQPQVFGGRNHYYAFGGDVFVDYPFGPNRRLSGQVNVVYYGGDANPRRGFGVGWDLGFAFGKWEPMIGMDYFKPSAATAFTGHLLGIDPGLAWWFIGHTVNVKLDLAIVKPEGAEMSKATFAPTLQTQLFF